MENPILARYSIRSKQEYIFRTNRLVEISGASKIIADAFEILFRCAHETGVHCERAYGPDSKTPSRFSLEDVLRRFADQSLDMVELFTGGGNCTVLFRDHETCKQVNMRYTRFVLENYPGLLPMYVGIELETGKPNYKADMDRLKEAEEIEKNRMFPARGGYALPFSKMDRVTFQPLNGYRNLGGERAEFSAESISKQDYERKHNDSQEGRDLDDIGSRLAIVHADGNNMGLKIQRFLKEKTDYDACITAMRQFTREIQDIFDAGKKAFDNAFDAIPHNEKDERYPVRWLVKAGDDATFICNAGYAEKLTEAYLRGVRNCPSASGETYSACAGICVFHAHYPCSRAYALAEQACDNAKKSVHDAAARGEPSEDGWLDFHVIQSGVGGDLKDLRSLHGTRDRMMRPWQVCGTMREQECDIQKLQELADILHSCGVSRGNLVTLGKVMEADANQGRLEWDRICYRNDLRRQNEKKPLHDLNRETSKLYPDWEQLRRALYDLSEVYDLWYKPKKAAEDTTAKEGTA